MQEMNPTQGLVTNDAPRMLHKDFYTSYALEDTNQASLYKRLAKFVKDQGKGFFIESLSPGSYVEDSTVYYTLIITASV